MGTSTQASMCVYKMEKYPNSTSNKQKLHSWFYFRRHSFTERGCLRPWAWGWRPVAVWLMMMTMMMRPLQPQLSEGKVLIRLPIRRVISAPLFWELTRPQAFSKIMLFWKKNKRKEWKYNHSPRYVPKYCRFSVLNMSFYKFQTHTYNLQAMREIDMYIVSKQCIWKIKCIKR